MRPATWIIPLSLVLGIASLAAGEDAATRPVQSPPVPEAVSLKGPLVLHLPGIAGYLGCDRHLLAGLSEGGVKAHVAVYDWTDNDPGLRALHAYERNQTEAQRVADMIVDHARLDPTSPIYLTSHSGGCGIAIWALEKLPADVAVDSVLLMAPALSPEYDLTHALRHVRGQLYAFTSVHDVVVLEAGTKLFGTIDGVLTAAAGFGGFVRPPGADIQLYNKLIPEPYEDDWMQYDDYGDHIGAMSRKFAANVLAPLLLGQVSPATRPSPTQIDAQ